jgi:hypothetical protein
MKALKVFLPAVFTVLLLPSTASAGWSSRRSGDRIDAVPLAIMEVPASDLSFISTLNAHLATANTALSSNELATLKLHPPFNSLSDSNIQVRFGVARYAVLNAIDALSYDDPALGATLLRLYANRRISVAFSESCYDSQLRDDGSYEVGDEAINLYEYPCGPVVPKLYSREMVSLIDVLGHQGKRALQAGYNGVEPTTQTLFASLALSNQLAEISVLLADADRTSRLLTTLDLVSKGMAMPINTRGVPWKIGDAILNDPSLVTMLDRQKTALSLRNYVAARIEPATSQRLNYRLTYQLNLQYYLGGQISPPTSYNGFIKKTGFFSYSTFLNTTGEFRYVTGYGGGGSFSSPPSPQYLGDSTFYQFGIRSNGTKQDFSWSVGLSYVSDARHWSNKLLIAGDDQPASQGVLRGYLDTNNDGIVDQASGREIMRGADMFGGLKLEWNPQLNRLMGFNRRTGGFIEFTGSDADGFPTGKVARGSITLRNDLMDFRSSLDGNWTLAWPDYNHSIDTHYITALSRWSTGTLQYASARVGYDFKEVSVNAALANGLRAGDTRIYATATPGWTCTAYRWDGMTRTPLDAAQADPNGHMIFYLGSPLQPGNRITVGSEISGWWSPNYTVSALDVPQMAPPRRTSLDRFQLEGRVDVRASYTFQKSLNLVSWNDDGTLLSSRFGDVFQDKTLTFGGSEFWRVRAEAKPIVAVPDYYSVGPGLKTELYPGFNDRINAMTFYGLYSPLNVNTGRFNFEATGKVDFAGLTGDPPFNFSYGAYSGGTTSAPATNVIVLDNKALTTPPVNQLDGQEVVRVWCLSLGGKNYPLYQFHLANNPLDACGLPHWHGFGPLAYPLETPNTGLPDPNPSSCGYGTLPATPPVQILWGNDEFEAFKILHFPPI